jgi:hypothetical protein
LSETDSMASAMPGMCEDRPEEDFLTVFAIPTARGTSTEPALAPH